MIGATAFNFTNYIAKIRLNSGVKSPLQYQMTIEFSTEGHFILPSTIEKSFFNS